ncbi:MAG: hypothetical protein QOJ65_1962 [Fimbriimonadaceae bacterium]|jgi:HEAT repeat protein/MFS family permease|nr:hypothetical protein [Fimbriimonadaceae bacterium]
MAESAPNRLQNLRSLRIANFDGAFATSFVTLTSGTVLVGYMKMLGAGDEWIGLLAALPNLSGILQIPGGVIGRRFESYKHFVAPAGFTWRALYAPLIILPLLAIPPVVALTILAVLVAVAWACNNVVAPVYNEWLSELVPPNARGFFFSRRNANMAATGAVVGIIGGLLLDWFKKAGHEREGFSTVFGLGMVCAAISLFLYMRMDDLKRANPVRQSLKEGIAALKTPFTDRGFRTVLVYIAMFVFGQMFAGNLFAAYAIERIRLPFTILQTLALVQAAGNVLSAPFWGYISDKYGNRPSLLLATVGITLTPIPWLFCAPGHDVLNTLLLIPLHLLSGVAWAGATLCMFNLVLATSKADERATYIGAALATQAILGGISPLLGGAMLANLRPFLGAQQGYSWIFILTSIFRFLSAAPLAFVREEGSTRLKHAFGELRRVTPRGYKAMRELVRSTDETSRQHAIQSVANEHLTLAADEIVKALHDPSPKVRRQAAAALAELKSAGAAEALIHQLVDHPDLVEEETVRALGETGGPSAVPHLVALMQSPRPLLRRSAIRALGNIGSADAIAALAQSAAEPGDPDSRRVALMSLRQLGATEAEPAICDALLDPAPSVRIVAAEAVEEMKLAAAAPVLRKSLEYYQDEASAEIAYALGTVGTVEDIPLILREAARSVSVITRRRCLLGVARILGVENDAYRLLLAEGIARDAALQQILRPLLRRKPRVRAAVERFSLGDEIGAMHALCSAVKEGRLAELEGQPVPELFLVAACVAAKG